MVVMKNMFHKLTFVVALLSAGTVMAEENCSISNTEAQLMAVRLIQDTKDSSDLNAIQDKIEEFLSLENELTGSNCVEAAEEINGAARISTALIAQKSIQNNINSQF